MKPGAEIFRLLFTNVLLNCIFEIIQGFSLFLCLTKYLNNKTINLLFLPGVEYVPAKNLTRKNI